MGTLNHRLIGRPLNILTSPEDLGVMTINKGMTETGSLKGWHGFDGLKLGNDYGYEGQLFDAWKDGDGINKWVVMPMVVLSGKDYPGENKYFGGNLFDNREKGDIKGTLTTSGSSDAKWYAPCTENRTNPDYVWGVCFSDGGGDWGPRDGDRFSIRPCLAQELTL
jgi:hypothetical protein